METSLLVHPDLIDRGSAKIRLPASFFISKTHPEDSHLKFKIDELVLVYQWEYPDHVCLCMAWPGVGLCVTIDTFISYPVASNAPIRTIKPSDMDNKAILYKYSEWNMFQLGEGMVEMPHLIDFERSFVSEISVRFIGDATRNSHTLTKKLQLKALIETKFVSKNSIVSYDHPELVIQRNGFEITELKSKFISTGSTPLKTSRNAIYPIETSSLLPCRITSATKINILPLADSITHNLKSSASNSSEIASNSSKTLSVLQLDNVGGLEKAQASLLELLEIPLKFGGSLKKMGTAAARGILLYGPPGVGKSLLVREVASKIGAPIIGVSATDIYSPILGQSELLLRQIFERASELMKTSKKGRLKRHQLGGKSQTGTRSNIEEREGYQFGGMSGGGVIIFIDEIDTICSKRDGDGGELEARVVAQLLTLLEETKAIVVAATNRPNALDPALRRPGRFDREIEIPLPDTPDRYDILRKCTRHVKLDVGMNQEDVFKRLSEVTIGWSGADLISLIREATLHALRVQNPLFNQNNGISQSTGVNNDDVGGVRESDFDFALTILRPTSQRGWTMEIPTTTWNDIGGLSEVKEKLKMMVEWPVQHAVKFKQLGLTIPRGVLLHGPPGCSKTTLVKAVANSCKASFVALSGADVFSPLLGESEKMIRDIFKKARAAKPSIIFFDEIDAMVCKRGSETDAVSSRILTQLLTEMDGIDSGQAVSFNEEVLVIAATNRPSALDAALLRPGRFDRIIEIPAPDASTRFDILKVIVSKLTLEVNNEIIVPAQYDGIIQDIFIETLKSIAEETKCFSGADLQALCREAGILALKRDINVKGIGMNDLKAAVSLVRPSLVHLDIASTPQKLHVILNDISNI